MIPTMNPQPPRMSNFPAGLGKGHDAAIVGSWLHSVFQNLDDGKIEPERIHGLAVGQLYGVVNDDFLGSRF